jgi:hypothetical protein
MRKTLIVLPLLLVASPAFAQEAPAPELPRALTDPATAQKLTGTMQALSSALLNLKVGEVKAVLDGRAATPEERNMTVGDLARRDDPNFDRHLQERMASIGPTVQQGMVALNRALPVMMRDLKDTQKSLERAVSNLPDPTYPKR